MTQSRYSPTRNLIRSAARHSLRHHRPAASSSEASGLPVERGLLKLSRTELIGFSLSCFERLAGMSGSAPAVRQPKELVIAKLIRKNLPGYVALKSELEAKVGQRTSMRGKSSYTQAQILLLRARIVECEAAIAEQVEETGDTIGLPRVISEKIANLTKAVLQRMAV